MHLIGQHLLGALVEEFEDMEEMEEEMLDEEEGEDCQLKVSFQEYTTIIAWSETVFCLFFIVKEINVLGTINSFCIVIKLLIINICQEI